MPTFRCAVALQLCDCGKMVAMFGIEYECSEDDRTLVSWERGEDVCAAHRVNLPVNAALNKASSIGETSKIEDWGP